MCFRRTMTLSGLGPKRLAPMGAKTRALIRLILGSRPPKLIPMVRTRPRIRRPSSKTFSGNAIEQGKGKRPFKRTERRDRDLIGEGSVRSDGVLHGH